MQKVDQGVAAMALAFIERELVWVPIEVKAKELFTALDTSGDGKIDLGSEAKDLENFNGKLLLQDMDEWGRGEVTLKEFLSAVKRMADKSGPMTKMLIESALGHLKKARAEASEAKA